ncbi:MAG: anaerobic ribonucleoside-triphosphate reductase activating protein [Candidatus Moranbacteria bacterium]|nr:anaerobic ribonucleoside-triphosphate reductase activating protein [Candidatus Moranbacteria bacterium]
MFISGIQKFTAIDFPGKLAAIVFTPGCNFRCKFCHNPEFVLPKELAKIRESFISEKAFFAFLEKRQGLLDGVVVTGGEPTIWPDLEDFIRRIHDMGFLVKLDSNGNNPHVLKDFVSKGLVDYVAMDVKTILSSYNDLVGPWAKPDNISESIEFLKEDNVPYEFRTTFVREAHSSSVIDGMVELLSGASSFFVQGFRPGITLDPAFSNSKPFSEAELMTIADRFRLVVPVVSVRM